MFKQVLIAVLIAVLMAGCGTKEPYSDLDNTVWFDKDKGNFLEFSDDGTVTMRSQKTGHSETFEFIREGTGLRIYKTGTKDTDKPILIFGQSRPNTLTDLHYGLHFVQQDKK